MRGLVGLIGLIMRPPAKSAVLYLIFFEKASGYNKKRHICVPFQITGRLCGRVRHSLRPKHTRVGRLQILRHRPGSK